MYFRYMLTPDEINIFSSMGKTKEYDAGAILFYEDTVADNFYIIKHNFEVRKEHKRLFKREKKRNKRRRRRR